MRKLSCLVALLYFLQIRVALACHDGSPLILDLNGDGIRTMDLRTPVHFDIDGDGKPEIVAWTNPNTEEGFLWLDGNRNRAVDGGRELFGDATLLPDGESARDGFQALAVYDTSDFGGNQDGLLSPEDLIWEDLRVWVDRDHNGLADPGESRGLTSFGVLEIGLTAQEREFLDGNTNIHRLQAEYLRRVPVPGGPPETKILAIEDIYFRIKHTEHEHP